MTYAILGNPGHNRVYFMAAKTLAVAELNLAAPHLTAKVSDIEAQEIGGVHYTTFKADTPLTDADMKLLSRLSFVYALFGLQETNGAMQLTPITKAPHYYLADDISSMLKYSGKTNEMFTRMMINVAAFCSDFVGEEPLLLLDPMAGKGTTLYEGLTLGHNVFGIELNRKIVDESVTFLKKYLQSQRLKYTVTTETLHLPQKSKATKTVLEIAKDKVDLKAGNARTATLVTGDARYADLALKKTRAHLLVADLPYGVQHGNVTNSKKGKPTRNPTDLLNACLHAWHSALLPGGCAVLAWNSFVLTAEEMRALAQKHGFNVKDTGTLNFEHRVDNAIRRDIIILKK